MTPTLRYMVMQFLKGGEEAGELHNVADFVEEECGDGRKLIF
jgi:ATP:corrinoid adenosyltransferase